MQLDGDFESVLSQVVRTFPDSEHAQVMSACWVMVADAPSNGFGWEVGTRCSSKRAQDVISAAGADSALMRAAILSDFASPELLAEFSKKKLEAATDVSMGLVLANPRLSDETLVSLFEQRDKMPLWAQGALRANPNLNRVDGAKDWSSNAITSSDGYFLGVMRYSESIDPIQIDFLRTKFDEIDSVVSDIPASTFARAALRRPDITSPTLASLVMDYLPSLETGGEVAASYRKLFATSGHRRGVKSGSIRPSVLLASEEREGKIFVISPEASAAEVERLHEQAKRFRISMAPRAIASVLSAAQTSAGIFQSALSEGNINILDPSFAQSPWAKSALTYKWKESDIVRARLRAYAQAVPSTTPEMLERMLKEEESFGCAPIGFYAHQNFPWKNFPLERINESRRDALPGALATIAVVGTMRSPSFARQVFDSPESNLRSGALLLAENTSGHQLAKIAATSPKLAAMAACHHNGTEIPLTALLPEDRAKVRRFREMVPAAALSGGGVPILQSRQETLSI